MVQAGSSVETHPDASIGLYLERASGRQQCSRVQPISCEDRDIATEGELFTTYYVYLSVFKADVTAGIAGLSVGLDYGSGVQMDSWTSCSDLDFPNGGWPANGSGNRIAWAPQVNCQQNEPGGSGDGVSAVAGFFTVSAYSDDTFAVGPNRGISPPEFKVADCASAESSIPFERAGYVAFSQDGSAKGSLPCGGEKEETTFGRVKSTYNNR